MILLLACAEPDLSLTASATPRSVTVTSSVPVDMVTVLDPVGVPVTTRRLTLATTTVEVPAELAPGTYTVEAHAGPRVASVPVDVAAWPPVSVTVQVVPGQAWSTPAGDVAVPLPDGEPADVLVAVTAGPGFPEVVPWSGGSPIPLGAIGARELRRVHVAEPTDVRVGETRFRLVPDRVDTATLAAALHVIRADFPAGVDGEPEPARAVGRIPLPSPLWQSLLHHLGLGTRARDRWAPWAYAGLALHNDGAEPVDLVVTAETLRDGVVDPAFHPRVRGADGDTGLTAALVRVPAHGDATLALPVFVDEGGVVPGEVDLRLVTRALGSDRALADVTRRIVVTRGEGVAGAGFVASVVACVAAVAWMGRRARHWLDERPTTELMTIALFGAALFVVGSASDIVSIAASALLGPFSSLLVGILADAGRTALLATLLTLFPRTGTLALAIVVGWLGRSFATGGFTPVDILYAGASVGYGEAFAWLAGLTRGGAWRDEPPTARFLRLSVGFGGASTITTLSGVWMHIVLFRLYFADWYVALQALVPGFLYVVLACALTVPFAASLRRVQA